MEEVLFVSFCSIFVFWIETEPYTMASSTLNLWTSWKNEYAFTTRTSNGCATTTIKASSNPWTSYSKCEEKHGSWRYSNMLLLTSKCPYFLQEILSCLCRVYVYLRTFVIQYFELWSNYTYTRIIGLFRILWAHLVCYPFDFYRCLKNRK